MSNKKPIVDKYLNEEELKKLITSISDLTDKTLILFTLETGLRRSEVVAIHTSNLDLESQTVQIFDFKKDEWRIAVYPKYISSQIHMYLDARASTSPLLFPFSSRTANRRLKRWCQYAGIRLQNNGESIVSFHWLRHTFIRRSKMAGRDIKVVQQNTGDTIETILKYYRNLSLEDRVFEIEHKPILDISDHKAD